VTVIQLEEKSPLC